MSKQDRAREILNYLAENEVAGTPSFIHHQLELFRNAKWSLHTTRRRLKDFRSVGYVDYLEDRGNGFYIITDAGRHAADEGLTDEDLEDILGRGDY